MNDFIKGAIVRVTSVMPADAFARIEVGMEGIVVGSFEDMADVAFPHMAKETSPHFPMWIDQIEVVGFRSEPKAPKAPKLCPQAVTVLQHLNEVGEMSGKEADYLYRVVDLPKRISEIRAAGFHVTSEWRRDNTGKRYKRYFRNATAAAA